MSWFDDKNNVDDYLKLADGYDGRDLIDVLKKHLPERSSVLELGMGPGKDLDILAENYKVTGSDSSQVFLDLYHDSHPKADVLLLDAVTLQTDRTFDCIFSNKVLQHIPSRELAHSFARQRSLLTDSGLLMHSLWYGESEEEYNGLLSVYYTEEAFLKTIGPGFKMIAASRYSEMEKDDSFYVLLQKS